jgi:hypothetical protein
MSNYAPDPQRVIVQYEYEGFRVHEQILGSVRRMGGSPRFTDIVICHTGYQDAVLLRLKSQRDLRLLEMEYAEQPDHPFTLFNLGSSYLELQRAGEASPLLERVSRARKPAIPSFASCITSSCSATG